LDISGNSRFEVIPGVEPWGLESTVVVVVVRGNNNREAGSGEQLSFSSRTKPKKASSFGETRNRGRQNMQLT